MKQAKKTNRKFSYSINGPYVFAYGAGSANAVVRMKANPWSIFKRVK